MLGEFKHGKSHGRGSYYFVDGRKYVGDWVEDMETGEGVFTWPDGDKYEVRCSEISQHRHHSVIH